MTKTANTTIARFGNKSRDNFASRFWKQRFLQAMALPGAIWMVIFCYWPMYGIIMAFKEYNITKPLMTAPWVGFKYFIEFFESESFYTIMRNTLGISVFKLFLGFPIPILFAVLLNELSSMKFKRIVQTISYLPHFLSWAVLGGIMAVWFSDTGVFNDVLFKIGLIKEPIAVLAEPGYFWQLSIISELWKETGWNAIIYIAAIASIEQQLYESANLDGANRFQKIWHITLPSIAGVIGTLFILNIGYLMNTNFDQIMILSNQLNLERSNVIELYVYRTGFQTGRYSYATAIGTFRSVIALILLFMANFTTRRLSGHGLF